MKLNTSFWLRISIFNLLIVALLGTLMRYKIGFEFPYFNQKNLQHAHSHFAFVGWVTHTLFVLMVSALAKSGPVRNMERYKQIIIANLVCSWGMLIAFGVGGYNPVSISLSTASILVSWLFAWYIFQDLKNSGEPSLKNWFTAALWFNIISSVGTFTLAWMMASHNFNQKIHLASLYFYLHFQYNGFFWFACMGLLVARIKELNPSYTQDRSVFWLFFYSCIPAYFLSVLWIKMPLWAYMLVAVSATTQVVAWIKFLISLKGKVLIGDTAFKVGKYILLIVVIAVSIKFLLQLGSTIPVVSKLAFGFRQIIIAYLHLILLAIISVFLVAYMYIYRMIRVSETASLAIVLFVVGVYLNEIILGIQGIASFSYTLVPYANESLFVVSGFIFLSIGLLLVSQVGKVIKTESP
jgi:hypothetical protein